MKKIIVWISILSTLLVSLPAQASLSDLYAQNGLRLPSVEVRKPVAESFGIKNYTGSKTQNLALESFLKSAGNDGLLGATPLPTDNYDSFLTSPLSASASTTYVNALPTGVSSTIYTIFATDGLTPSEKIFCTDKATSPNRLTGCVRGLSFSPTNGVIDETAGTGSSHSKNARIAITDNINFSGKALSYLYGFQSIPAVVQFGYLPTAPTTTPTSSNQLVTFGYLNTVTSTGCSADASETARGCSELATGAEAAAGTSLGSTGARLVLPASLASSTSSGSYTSVMTNSAGKVSATFGGSTSTLATLDANTLVVQNPANATSTPGANKIVQASSTGLILDGWINTSTIAGNSFNIQNFVAGETINASSVPQAVYLKESDGRVYKLDSTSATEAAYAFVGFAVIQSSVSSGNNILIQTNGVVSGFSGLTVGGYYFGTNTAGTVSTTAGSQTLKLGRAVTASTILIQVGRKVTSGVATFSATVTTTVTIGFRPNKVTVYTVQNSANTYFSSGGWTPNSSYNVNTSVFFSITGGEGGGQNQGWRCGNSAAHMDGIIDTISSTGFRLNNTKTGSAPDCSLVYIAED